MIIKLLYYNIFGVDNIVIVLGSRRSKTTAKAISRKIGAHYTESNIPETNEFIIRYGNSYVNDPNDFILNTKRSVQISSNKPKTKKLLIENNISTPKLISFEDVISGNCNFPVIVRKNRHFKGKYFYVCDNSLSVCRFDPNNYYIQEMVNKIDEFRLFILKDKIIEANIKRCPSPNIMIRNKENGCFFARIRVSELPIELKNNARKAMKEIGLDFGAIDCATIKDDNDNIVTTIFEVNSAPGLIPRKIDLLVSKLTELEII